MKSYLISIAAAASLATLISCGADNTTTSSTIDSTSINSAPAGETIPDNTGAGMPGATLGAGANDTAGINAKSNTSGRGTINTNRTESRGRLTNDSLDNRSGVPPGR